MDGCEEDVMAIKKTLTLLWVTAVTSIGLFVLPAFAATPGTWDGTAEFGTFELEVNSAGTGIENITYHFSEWTCGSVKMSGGIGITPGTSWPISNNSFSFTNNLDPDKEMTISGSFDSSTQAAGPWEAVVNGTRCAGNWEATGPDNGQGETYDVTIDHAFVKGVYWNPDELPGWGFFVDVQEETFFGAIYGYQGADSTFITLQGKLSSADPMIFQGNVYFITNGGSTATDVGNFSWTVGDFEAEPAALLTLTSNILDVTDLGLVRFSYSETDKVDVLTGGYWNIIRRMSNVTYGDHYEITDTRTVEDGVTYARVVDQFDTNLIGAVGYMELDEGDFYVMLIEFDNNDFLFYGFLASNADMYGRYWLLAPDEEPTGDGNHFRAAADTMQAEGSGGSVLQSNSKPNGALTSEMKSMEKSEYKNTGQQFDPMFPESAIQTAYEKLVRAYQSFDKQLQ